LNVRSTVTLENVNALLEGRLERPTDVLGPQTVQHAGRKMLAVRAFLPDVKQAWLLDPTHGASRPMRRIHPAGLYEGLYPLESGNIVSPDNLNADRPMPAYQLRAIDHEGEMKTLHDPYAFAPLMTDFDLHLFGEGKLHRGYEKLGAQIREVNGVRGTNFAVWAPNARSVSIVGDFNQWDGRRNPMKLHATGGVWELFIPGLNAGEKYKFRVRQSHGEVVDKSDPYGFAAELPPCTASIVTDLSRFEWHDGDWMHQRANTNQLEKPISVYEVHLGSWKRGAGRHHGWLNYRDLAHQLVAYCLEMGYTHIELMPISEHPFSGSWGYQTVGYFAVTSRYGTPEDFAYFVDYFHRHGIGVILDWVPAHFPRDGHGLRRFDGTACFEHEDPRKGEHPDWGTMIFNYGRTEVRNFLLANALFWLDKYHIDGLRVDAVASMLYLDYSRKEGQWIPNQYGGRENLEAISLLQEFNIEAHASHPGVLTIAEESTAWGGVSRPTYTGGLGFSLKWNMGWMNDTLRYMREDPIHRRFHHDELTFSLIYAFTENFALPLSHDEVVHGKRAILDQMPGDLWQKFANLRLLYSYMWTHPGKKLLFMGSDFGQWNEWNHDAELQWDLLQWDTHRGVKKMVADLNALIRREPALHEVDFDSAGFEWIECQARDDSVLAYIRKGKDPEDFVVVVCNFTPVVRDNYPIGVPRLGWYQEIFNSDSQFYDGSNVGNFPGVMAEEPGWHFRPAQLKLRLPPLATVVLKPEKK
jgi:1,4-alpha-glucan branching enzyme